MPSEPSGPGAARDAAGPRLSRGCLGALEVGRVLENAMGCHRPRSDRCREWPGNPHAFSAIAQRMWARDGAMGLTGEVSCVHSMGDVLGRGCSLPSRSENIVSIVGPSFSWHLLLSRSHVQLVSSRPLSCVRVGAEGGVPCSPIWVRGEVVIPSASWVRLWPESPVCAVPRSFL
jgi:hypothetical protein